MGEFTAQSESRTHDRPKTSPRKTTEPSHCISNKNVVENIYSGDRFFARRTIGRESDGGRASPEQLENNLKTESFVLCAAYYPVAPLATPPRLPLVGYNTERGKRLVELGQNSHWWAIRDL